MRVLKDIFLDELEDRYDAERRLSSAMPHWEAIVSYSELKDHIARNIATSEKNIKELEKVFIGMSKKLTGKKCHATIGMLVECNAAITNNRGDTVINTTLIILMQKISLYKTLSYKALKNWADHFEDTELVEIFQKIISEEEAIGKSLQSLAQNEIKHVYPQNERYHSIKKAAEVMKSKTSKKA